MDSSARQRVVDDLRQRDFVGHPVWRYISFDSRVLEPVAQAPVTDLEQCLVGTTVQFANGSRHFAMVGNIEVQRPDLNQHFLSLSLFNGEKRFYLPRYHDVTYETRGPQALAVFLGLTVEEIFPIAYDLGDLVTGVDPQALRGIVTATPVQRLTSKELLDLYFSSRPGPEDL